MRELCATETKFGTELLFFRSGATSLDASSTDAQHYLDQRFSILFHQQSESNLLPHKHARIFAALPWRAGRHQYPPLKVRRVSRAAVTDFSFVHLLSFRVLGFDESLGKLFYFRSSFPIMTISKATKRRRR